MEVWKDIKGYEGMYQISSLGRVKSLKRKGVTKDKILKGGTDGRGYKSVNLCLYTKSKTFKIHQLVAIAFLNHTPCGHKIVVDHINGDTYNNNVGNLQLITQRENSSKDRVGYSSRYVGVRWNKTNSNWTSQIGINGKLKHLGCFDCELEAAEAYQKELNKINNQ